MSTELADAWHLAQTLIGRRVEVVLQHEPRVTAVGRLLKLDDEGECQIEHDDGVIRFCWPLLGVQKAATCLAVYEGHHWAPKPCERATGHLRAHCDQFGRTW